MATERVVLSGVKINAVTVNWKYCLVTASAEINCPPHIIWNILTHPQNHQVFRSVKACTYRQPVDDELEVEHIGQYSCMSLLGSHTFRIRQRVVEDEDAGKIAYRLATKGMMSVWDGTWSVQGLPGCEPLDEDNCWDAPAGGPAYTLLQLDHKMQLTVWPMPPFDKVINGVVSKALEDMLVDLVREADRVRKGTPKLAYSSSLRSLKLDYGFAFASSPAPSMPSTPSSTYSYNPWADEGRVEVRSFALQLDDIDEEEDDEDRDGQQQGEERPQLQHLWHHATPASSSGGGSSDAVAASSSSSSSGEAVAAISGRSNAVAANSGRSNAVAANSGRSNAVAANSGRSNAVAASSGSGEAVAARTTTASWVAGSGVRGVQPVPAADKAGAAAGVHGRCAARGEEDVDVAARRDQLPPLRLSQQQQLEVEPQVAALAIPSAAAAAAAPAAVAAPAAAARAAPAAPAASAVPSASAPAVAASGTARSRGLPPLPLHKLNAQQPGPAAMPAGPTLDVVRVPRNAATRNLTPRALLAAFMAVGGQRQQQQQPPAQAAQSRGSGWWRGGAARTGQHATAGRLTLPAAANAAAAAPAVLEAKQPQQQQLQPQEQQQQEPPPQALPESEDDASMIKVSSFMDWLPHMDPNGHHGGPAAGGAAAEHQAMAYFIDDNAAHTEWDWYTPRSARGAPTPRSARDAPPAAPAPPPTTTAAATNPLLVPASHPCRFAKVPSSHSIGQMHLVHRALPSHSLDQMMDAMWFTG